MALIETAYVEPTCPEGIGPAMIFNVAGALCTGATTIEYVTDLVWLFDAASVTVTPKVNVPDVVGVPEITPLFARFSPDGRLPDERLHL